MIKKTSYTIKDMECAFRRGLVAGYAIDHENITVDENKALQEFMTSLNRESVYKKKQIK